MHIDQLNIDNLTQLWKKYGAIELEGRGDGRGVMNRSWPHRFWMESFSEHTEHLEQDIIAWLQESDRSLLLPVWQTEQWQTEQWQTEQRQTENLNGMPQWLWLETLYQRLNYPCVLEQTAMCLSLEDAVSYIPGRREGFTHGFVDTLEALDAWVETSSFAFDYVIDKAVIRSLYRDSNMKLILGRQDGEAVATALLFKTGKTIGLHQMGVHPAFWGRGIAKCFMQVVLHLSAEWQGEQLVLQASTAGKPLYESLGFETQFSIKVYQSHMDKRWV